jgi:tetratricopeptide (TPR) repeat protein
MNLTFKTKLLIVLTAIVCITVLITHWPALSAKAITFDDNQYLTENTLVQNHSFRSAWRFLTEVLTPSTVHGYYQPLAMISLMFDHVLGGSENNLMPFHRTSLMLHTANTALIIVLLYLLFENVWAAVIAGLLFGVHPMTVEPIPWVGERKTLLAAFFALWCLIFYVRYVRTTNRRFYAACLGTYILALMSKPTSTPLPLVMLLMDYWPLKRTCPKFKIVVEKLPFFVIGGVSSVITYISQSRTAATVLPAKYGPMHVPFTLCHNIIFYLYKMVWPANLSSHYAFPKPMDLSNSMVLAGVIGTAILIPLLLISLRWTRAALTGWLIFFMAILPTMGVVGFTNVIASDKFAYLPSVGILMMVCSFLVWLLNKGKAAAVIVMAVVLALSAGESVATRRYLVHWRDTASLFEYMLTLTPNAASLHNMLGIELDAQGRFEEAVEHFREALKGEIDRDKILTNTGNSLLSQGKFDEAEEYFRQSLKISPYDPETITNMANMFCMQGKFDEAENYYHRALKIKPDYVPAHYNFGVALQMQGRTDEAIPHYRQALKLKPDDTGIYNNLGCALISENNLSEAVEIFNKALRITPNNAELHYNLGNALRGQGQTTKAIEHYRSALQIKPDYAKAHNNLGIALELQGKPDEAFEHYRKAIQIRPDYVDVYYNAGFVLQSQGKLKDAIDYYRRSLKLDPNYVLSLNDLAKILAEHPDPKVRNITEAVTLAERADELTKHQNIEVLETLAEAYAAAGKYEQAVTAAQTALKLANAAKNEAAAERISKRLELYKRGRR